MAKRGRPATGAEKFTSTMTAETKSALHDVHPKVAVAIETLAVTHKNKQMRLKQYRQAMLYFFPSEVIAAMSEKDKIENKHYAFHAAYIELCNAVHNGDLKGETVLPMWRSYADELLAIADQQ